MERFPRHRESRQRCSEPLGDCFVTSFLVMTGKGRHHERRRSEVIPCGLASSRSRGTRNDGKGLVLYQQLLYL